MSFRLLIVEDSLELLEATGDFFREEGAGLWEVVTASDGNDALAKVSNDNFDLMILDIMLPGASGFDICKAARKRSDCPIIFVTAQALTEPSYRVVHDPVINVQLIAPHVL